MMVLVWSDLQLTLHLKHKPLGVLTGVPDALDQQLLHMNIQGSE